MNRIGDTGAKILAESLTFNKTLERLDIGSNRIEAEGIKYLCDAIKDNPTLIMFNLGMYKATADIGELCNRIGNKGATYISDLLKHNKIIKILDIGNNDITEEGIKEIANVINETNNTLLYLDYTQYGLNVKPEIKEIIIKKLNENCINNLNMDYNTFIKNKLSKLKHTDKIDYIDSIYRNAK